MVFQNEDWRTIQKIERNRNFIKSVRIFRSRQTYSLRRCLKCRIACTTPFMTGKERMMTKTNDYDYYETSVTYAGTPGCQYYALVTVTAGDSSGSDSKSYVTGIVTAKP